MEHESALPKEFRFDEYEIIRVLGAGGFGITYLSYDHNLDKPMAIKEYLPNDLAVRKGDTEVVAKSSTDRDDFAWGMARFLEEARVLAQFDHPNMPKVYRFFEQHGTGYIVMEYVEGETLSACYKRQGTLSQAELEKIILPLLKGLETVHAAGYLHRDIKPSNIIIRDNGSPVLIDFGSARAAIGAKSRSITSIVTPGYAPIEQYSTKGNQGPWTDIYALGAVLYRGVSGKPPDDATDRILNDELVPLVQAGVSGDKPFLAAIDWALQVRELERPTDIAQWHNMLIGNTANSVERVASGRVKAPKQQKPNRRSSVFVPILVAIVVIGVIGFGGLSIWKSEPIPESTPEPTPELAPSLEKDQDDNKKWELVVKANTVEEYRQYIATEGLHSDLAKEKINILERDYWAKTIKQNNVEAYKKYARLFPDSAFSELAKLKGQN